MEEAIQEIYQTVRENLTALEEIWESVGIPEHQVTRRRRDFILHVKNLVETMKNEETNARKRILENIQRNKRMIADIKERVEPLSIEELSSLKLTRQPESETLLEMDKRLECEKLEHEKLRIKRIERVRELIALCRTLADEVSATPHDLTTLGDARIPAHSEIEQLEKHCKELAEIKKSRLQRFRQIRPNIAKWMRDLGDSPDETFLINILMEPDEEFKVTIENMEKLESLETEVKEKWNYRMEEIRKVKTEIKKMWDLLKTSQLEREEFQLHVKGITLLKDLEQYQVELDRLTAKRRNSLASLTRKAKEDLNLLRKEAKILPPIDEDLYQPPTEDFLNTVLGKLDITKNLLEERRPILAKMSNWSDKIKQLEELVMKSKDPARLKNRGGNLLEEERMRKSLEKSLPKITSALTKSVESWEVKYGRFCIDGMTLEEYRTSLMMRMEGDRQNEHSEKKRKRQLETEVEMRFGSANPNKAKKVKPCGVKIKIDKSYGDGQCSTNMNVGEAHLTPWGSMKYSPISLSPRRPTKQLTSVAKAIKEYTSKLLQPGKKTAKTTENILVPTSRLVETRKMRRRSKSLSCISKEVLQKSTLKPFKSGSRLPMPSTTDLSKLLTPRFPRTQDSSSTMRNSLHAMNLHAERSPIDLSDTIENNPRCMDQSVSNRIGSVSQREFESDLLGDRPKNARSSIIPRR